jgi:DNA-binding protein H-NS
LKSTKELKAEIVAVNKQLDADIAQLRRVAKARVSELEAQIKQISSSEIRAAKEQVLAVLAQHGLSVKDLNVMVPKERVRRAPTQKYIGPNGETWSGMGRQPQWLKGQDKSKFLAS